jgi:Uri superfamily endonuclease
LTEGLSTDRGTYVLLIFLKDEHTITVGKLGPVRFRSGTYAYCGSAMAGYRGRVGRHFSKEKKLRWHIDYLLQVAEPVGAYLVPGGEGMECMLGGIISSLDGSEPIEGFGSSDCSCRSHLCRIDDRSIDALTGLITDLTARRSAGK